MGRPRTDVRASHIAFRGSGKAAGGTLSYPAAAFFCTVLTPSPGYSGEETRIVSSRTASAS